MKKMISLLICTALLMTGMCIMADAANDTYSFEREGYNYTIEINDANVSNEKKQAIANALVGANESNIMTTNIWCDLFGHDYKYTTASMIQHKVNVYNPRCKMQTYDVTYCEDCDYTEQTLVAVSYINCCPEE